MATYALELRQCQAQPLQETSRIAEKAVLLMGERGPQPGEGGRPPKVIDVEVARRAAGIGCTSAEIAALLGIGRRTFFDHLEHDEALRDAIEEGRANGRVALRRMQWKEAQAGSGTMLVWLGKQLLGQRDRHEVAHDPDSSLSMLHLIAAKQIAQQMQELLAAGVKPNGNGHANGNGANGSNGHGRTIDGLHIDFSKPALE